MRRTTTVLLAGIGIAVVGAAVAPASTSRVVSQPNGDISLLVSMGCGGSDRDKDGDFNTCAGGDTASLLYSVGNQSDIAQTIRIDYALDGPGTELDHAFSKEVGVEPGQLFDEFDEFRVQHNKTPLGEYTLSVTASGSETASTSATFTVHTKNGK